MHEVEAGRREEVASDEEVVHGLADVLLLVEHSAEVALAAEVDLAGVQSQVELYLLLDAVQTVLQPLLQYHAVQVAGQQYLLAAQRVGVVRFDVALHERVQLLHGMDEQIELLPIVSVLAAAHTVHEQLLVQNQPAHCFVAD